MASSHASWIRLVSIGKNAPASQTFLNQSTTCITLSHAIGYPACCSVEVYIPLSMKGLFPESIEFWWDTVLYFKGRFYSFDSQSNGKTTLYFYDQLVALSFMPFLVSKSMEKLSDALLKLTQTIDPFLHVAWSHDAYFQNLMIEQDMRFSAFNALQNLYRLSQHFYFSFFIRYAHAQPTLTFIHPHPPFGHVPSQNLSLEHTDYDYHEVSPFFSVPFQTLTPVGSPFYTPAPRSVLLNLLSSMQHTHFKTPPWECLQEKSDHCLKKGSQISFLSLRPELSIGDVFQLENALFLWGQKLQGIFLVENLHITVVGNQPQCLITAIVL